MPCHYHCNSKGQGFIGVAEMWNFIQLYSFGSISISKDRCHVFECDVIECTPQGYKNHTNILNFVLSHVLHS